MLKTFRLRGKAFMLTYNTIWLDKEKAMDKLRKEFKTATYIGICHEKGEEKGRDHTHIVMTLSKATDRTGQKCVTIEEKIPNVKPMRGKKHIQNAKEYLHKEDINALTWGEEEEEEEKKELTIGDIWDMKTEDELRGLPTKIATQAFAAFDRKPEEKITLSEWTRHPWQEQADDILADMSDREVVWIYDKIGGTGKSTWGERSHIEGNALYISYLGKVENFIEALWSGHKTGWDGGYVIIDLTRQQAHGCAVYQCIEECNRLIHTRQKYTSRTFTLKKKTRVCIVANWAPEVNKLSKDRWKIYRIAALTLEERPLEDIEEENNAERLSFD